MDSTTEQDILNMFVDTPMTQQGVKFIKDKYKEFYGFTKKQNDSRLYPRRDLLKEDYEYIYKLYLNEVYDTASRMEYGVTQNPEWFKNNVLFQNDSNPDFPINSNSLLLSSFVIPNFLQAKKVFITDQQSGKTSTYVMNDHALITNPTIQEEALNETRLEYMGNNFSNMMYYTFMNPVFSEVNKKANPIEGYQIFEALRSISTNGNELDNLSDNDTSCGFYTFIHDVIKSVFSTKPAVLEVLDTYGIDNLLSNDTYTTNQIPIEVRVDILSCMDTIYKCYMKVAPYILSPLYSTYTSSPIAHIFFMSLSIICIKKLYSIMNNSSSPMHDQASQCVEILISNSASFINDHMTHYNGTEFEATIVDDLFEKYGPSFLTNILDGDVQILIDSLFNTSSEVNITTIGKDATKYSPIASNPDSSIAVSSLIELFYKFENVRWFDDVLFEVNVNDKNIDILTNFASSLLEASLIYKNSLMMGSSNVKIKTHNDMKGDFYSYDDKACLWKMDRTCTITKEPNYHKDENFEATTDFAAINCMISLANSIQLCADNTTKKDEMILLNSQMKRSSCIMNIWKEYIRQFLYESDAYRTESLTHMDTITSSKNALLFLSAVDYGMDIKTWVYDSYHFWRSYKKIMMQLQTKDLSQCWNLYAKYNDMICPIFKEMNSLSLVPYVRGFATLPIAGIYSYSNILGNLRRYTPSNVDFILSAFSRILMKDLYIFGDQEAYDLKEYKDMKYAEDHFEYPFVIRDRTFQKCLNLFTADDYERILASTYVNWYLYDANPIVTNSPELLAYIQEAIPSLNYTEIDIQIYKLNGMYGQIFGYESMWYTIVNNASISTFNLLISIFSCIKFLSIPTTINNNLSTYNNYSAFKDNKCNSSINILGLELLVMDKHSTEEYNFFGKLSNILIPMCMSRINNSIDDVYKECKGLPIYLFYKNGIGPLVEGIYTNENEMIVRELHCPLSEACIDFTNTIVSNLPFIETELSKYNGFKDLSLDSKLIVVDEILKSIKMYNSYTNSEINAITSSIDEIGAGIGYINFGSCLSNFELYCKAIIHTTLNTWNEEQYTMYIFENIPRLNMYSSIRNEIIHIKNINNIEPINKINNDTIDTSIPIDIKYSNNIPDEETAIYNGISYRSKSIKALTLYTPEWEKITLAKFDNNPAIKKVHTEVGKNGVESLRQIIKYLGSQNHRFMFETYKPPERIA